MTDYVWPDDLSPRRSSFYLRPHVLRQRSPITRAGLTLELSAPIWICRLGFRGWVDGTEGKGAIGPRLDAWIAKLKGGANRVALWDFNRPMLRGSADGHALVNGAAAAGATSMSVTGFAPGARAFYAGDYVGGDGRAHIVTDDPFTYADASGAVTVHFLPPLDSAIAAGAAIYGKTPSWFILQDDDAGENSSEAGEPVEHVLAFEEDR